jgi:hypothetical protein
VQPYRTDASGQVNNNQISSYTSGLWYNYANGSDIGVSDWTFSGNNITAPSASPAWDQLIYTGTPSSFAGIRIETYIETAKTYEPTANFENNTIDGDGAATPEYLAVRGMFFRNVNGDASQNVTNITFANNEFSNVEVGVQFSETTTVEFDLAPLYANDNTYPAGMVINEPYQIGYAPVTNVTQSLGYNEIQPAIDEANANDVIEVAAGTYSEVLLVDKPLSLLGPNAEISAVDGSREDEAVLTERININATENVTISGFEFFEVSATSTWTIYIQGVSNNFTFENNRFINNEKDAIRSGITSSTGNVTVKGNLIEGITNSVSSGILLGGIYGTSVIADNKIDLAIDGTPTGYAGIQTPSADGLTISGNEILNTTDQGLQLAGACGDVNIENNTITNTNTSGGTDKGAIRIYGDEFTGTISITGNTLTNSYNGFAVKDGMDITGKDILVTNNNLSGNSNLGVYNGGTGTLIATCNYWGTNNPVEIASAVSGDVQFLPFSTSADPMNCDGMGPVMNATQGFGYLAIQEAINKAAAGDRLNIFSGIYPNGFSTTDAGGLNLAFGGSPGCVTIEGDVTYSSDDAIEVDVWGPTECTEYDKVTVNGTLTLNNASLSLALNGYTPAAGTEFVLYEATLINGTFALTTLTSGNQKFEVETTSTQVKLVAQEPGTIDIAVKETGCAQFKVVLRPDFDMVDDATTNVQFTLQYPEDVELTDLTPMEGFNQGATPADANGYKYITYVAVDLTGTTWAAGTEYTVLTFSHDQSSPAGATGNFTILDTEESQYTYYAEYSGSDATGVMYEDVQGVRLDGCPVATVFLQGAYDGAGGMNTDLVNELPANQPFNAEPWNYAGTETLSEDATGVVDWVLLEIRDANTESYTVVEQKAALLMADGSIRTSFASTLAGTEYLVVHHRNHMPLISAATVSSLPVDLTVEGNSTGGVTLSDGKIGMLAGDINSDGRLQYSGPNNDRGLIIAKIIGLTGGTDFNQVFVGGYFDEDVNLDNALKYTGDNNDRDIIYSNIDNFTDPTYLNSIYESTVPGALVDLKSATISNGPVAISVENEGVTISTEETISNGLIDNIQFTLAWEKGDEAAFEAVRDFSSRFNVQPMGDPVEIDGVSHQVFVSVNLTELPADWTPGEELSVMEFNTAVQDGKLWIADNEFTRNNNAMYYVSVNGIDFTGEISAIAVGTDEFGLNSGIRVYPNPSSHGYINISLPQLQGNEVELAVFDLHGRMLNITTVSNNSGEIQLDLPQLSNGVYNLKVTDGYKVFNERFILSN